MIGGLIGIISIYCASIAPSPGLFYVFYAFGLGVGKGFIYPSALAAGYSHLPGRKGMVSGIIVSAVGFGAFIYGILSNRLVNPDNVEIIEQDIGNGIHEYYFPKEINDRVPHMLRTIAYLWCLQIIIGMFLITDFKHVNHENSDSDLE